MARPWRMKKHTVSHDPSNRIKSRNDIDCKGKGKEEEQRDDRNVLAHWNYNQAVFDGESGHDIRGLELGIKLLHVRRKMLR